MQVTCFYTLQQHSWDHKAVDFMIKMRAEVQRELASFSPQNVLVTVKMSNIPQAHANPSHHCRGSHCNDIM
ncbi:hypothetical protein I79_010185 [Cricetulus griseus]|uniref:Uncharacterized protein n=1 Tax=Cricetulus griseus TaxID=10029 RepID=G3HHS6_CRIGR|nr:hypothetical protein I79_010185 [Cricetulus griseus]